jgi:hypothetical protein
VIAKCVYAYKLLIDYVGTKGIWEVCNEYFRETRDEMCRNTDYLYTFLTLGPGDNTWNDKVHGGKFLYFIQRQGKYMLLEEFKKKFQNWMRSRHPNVRYKWNNDFSAFKRLGYEVVSTKVCKACKKPADKSCCKDYSHANRTMRTIIRHIVCVEEVEEYVEKRVLNVVIE